MGLIPNWGLNIPNVSLDDTNTCEISFFRVEQMNSQMNLAKFSSNENHKLLINQIAAIRQTRYWLSVFLLLFGTSHAVLGQFHFGSISSIVLSNSNESSFSDYTLNLSGANDAGTGSSFIPVGHLAQVQFPVGTSITNCTGGSVTVGASTFPIVAYNAQGSNSLLQFTIPTNIPAQSAFIITLNNIVNPPINSSCGILTNDFYSVGPCNEGITLVIENINQFPFPIFGFFGSNTYDHVAVNSFTIQAVPYSITVEESKLMTNEMIIGQIEQEVVRIKVHVKGSLGTIPTVSQMNLNVGSTTNLAAIVNASVYSTGTDSFFHSANENLLGLIPGPGNMMSFNMNYSLQVGNNYFFLVYDIHCDQLLTGNYVDGALDDILINGTSLTPLANVSGARRLHVDYTQFSGPNLVPNPSFETYATCPNFWMSNTVSFPTLGVPGWESPTFGTPVISGTSDYFNACDVTNSMGVPKNLAGNQSARTGVAYAGTGHNVDGSNSEYLQIQLQSPLIAGIEYALNYFVSRADTSDLSTARNGFGGYVSTTKIVPSSAAVLQITPHIIEMGVVLDQFDWQPINGTFVANGGEQWLLIGEFLDSTLITSIAPDVVNTGTLYQEGNAYYYIDDVSLVPLSEVDNCLTPLAAELLDFNVVKVGDRQVNIEWERISDVKTEYFSIHRSADGLNWAQISKIDSKGLENTLNNYMLSDFPTFDQGYYQLIAVDVDGVEELIGTRFIKLKGPLFQLYPNPFNDESTVIFDDGVSSVTIEIIDMTGRIVSTFIKVQSKDQLTLSQLNSGSYIIRIVGSDSLPLRILKSD